jgi:hypothetical protein
MQLTAAMVEIVAQALHQALQPAAMVELVLLEAVAAEAVIH